MLDHLSYRVFIVLLELGIAQRETELLDLCANLRHLIGHIQSGDIASLNLLLNFPIDVLLDFLKVEVLIL